jgi:hypothetical protein
MHQSAMQAYRKGLHSDPCLELQLQVRYGTHIGLVPMLLFCSLWVLNRLSDACPGSAYVHDHKYS